MFKKIFFLATVTLALITIINPVSASNTSCTDLSYNLRQGARDAQTSGSVTKLQNYLQQINYLSTSPSGYFGAMTLKAVQKFQSDNDISSTGYVGPTTRNSIKRLSCSGTATQPHTNTSSNTPTTTPVVASCSVNFTSPYLNQRFDLNTDTINPTWNNVNCEASSTFIAILSRTDPSGTWDVTPSSGPVTNSTGAFTPDFSKAVLSDGYYKMFLEQSNTKQRVSDIAQFYVVAKASNYQPVSISSLSSITAANDGQTSTTVYGNSFTASSTVYLGSGQNIKITPTSIDSSGTSLVFVVPTVAGYGPASVSVSNDGKKFSNQLPFTVIAPSFSKYYITSDFTPSANIGVLYDTNLSAGGFQKDYKWSISSGSLPTGLSLNNSVNGYMAPSVIYGIPQTAGSFPFTVTVTDLDGNTASRKFTIVVGADPNANNPIPAIYGQSQTSGQTGTSVNLIGRSFTSRTFVLLNGRIIGDPISSSDGKNLSFTIPTITKSACNLFGQQGSACTNTLLVVTPGAYTLTVETSGGESAPSSFTILPTPQN